MLSVERKLMDHWHKKYPDILTVNFEKLIQNFEIETRLIFNYLSLEWRSSIHQFYQQQSFTNTASYDQVKQPINASVINQYDGFIPYLSSFKKQLDHYNVVS